MSYGEALSYLASLSMLGVKPGTERLAEALRRLSQPQDRFAAIHIAGTNGKGSTAAFSASLLCTAAGASDGKPRTRIGLYTSPHLVRVRERIRYSDDISATLHECGEDELHAALSRIRAVCADPPAVELTFFEVLTAAAFVIFAERGVDIAVIETGLGGRLDATRLCRAEATVITSIGLDHTELLGPTLKDIAREKAGIFRPDVPAFAACDDDEARAVLLAEAASASCTLALYDHRGESGATPLEPLPPSLESAIALAGEHQKRNAALAISAVHALKLPPALRTSLEQPAVQREGLAKTRWPGRLERLWPAATDGPTTEAISARLQTSPPPGCEIWLDAAHNPEGAAALARFLDDNRRKRPLTILLGVVAGKDAAAMCQPLAAAHEVILTRPPSPRGLDPAQLLPLLPRPALICDDYRDALRLAIAKTAPDGLLMIYGSLFLVGAIRSRWLDEAMDPLWVQDPMAKRPG